MDYKRSLEKFVSTGIELNTPINLMPPGKFPFLKNVRGYQGGILQGRQGLLKVNQNPIADLQIHTLSRMNDYIFGDFIRFIGANSTLYAGQQAFASVDTGFTSGTPWSIVPFRPDNSVEDWAYISSKDKQIKINSILTKYRVGIAPPTVVPTMDLRSPSYAVADAMGSVAGWSVQGIANTLVAGEQLQGAATNLILSLDETTGLVSIVPANTGRYWDIGTYDMVKIAGLPVLVMDLCHCPEPSNISSIAAEIVDSSGQAIVQPVANIRNLKRDTAVQLAGSFVRVLSIKADNQQVNSFRASHPFAAVGAAVTAPTHSFRAPITGGGAITKNYISAQFTGGGDGTLTNVIGFPGHNLGSTFDGRSIGPNDYLTFSLFVNNLSNITNVRVILDTDPSTATPGVVGTKNALFMDLLPADFDGNNAWKTFRTRVAAWQKIGQDDGCSLNNVTGIQVKVTTDSSIDSTAATEVRIGFVYTSGTYGPDTATNLTPFQYRYRYRSSSTGARSLPGPSLESGILAQREAVILNGTSSSDPQVDKVDWERLGGSNDAWHYIGTSPNSAPRFVDGQASEDILTIDALEIDRYMTFPIADVPYSATVNVSGCLVKFVASPGGAFNPNWSRGTEVIVNGVRTVMESSPDPGTGTFLVSDSLGGLNGVELDITSPITAGQPMPRMWGPFVNTLFGCGSLLSPGTLYFTNEGDPDSASVLGTLDITTPSETLMNGCLYEGRNYVWSDKRFFSILPINNPNAPEFKFQYTEVPTARGMWAPWAFAVGPKMWYLGPDGIYETEGGAPVLITNDIAPLFPRGDRLGFAVNGINPVKMGDPGVNADSNLKLTYSNGYLFFDYVDSVGNFRTLVYDTIEKAWYYDQYFEGNAQGITARFAEYGESQSNEVSTLICASAGTIYVPGGTGDDTFEIKGQVDTSAKDFGDSRAKKIYAEITPELNTNSVEVTITPYGDNFQTAFPLRKYTNVKQEILHPIDLSGGIGVFARNLSVRLTWSSRLSAPQLFSWEPSYLERPVDSFLRADDWTDGGYSGSKYLKGFMVEADTEGVGKVVELDVDQQTVQTYIMTHAGQTTKVYTVKPQFIGTLFRLAPKQDVMWREFSVSYIYEKYPELSDLVTPYTDADFQGPKLMRGFDLEAMGPAANVIVEYDGGLQGPIVPVDHSTALALHTKPYAFRPPFIATELRLNPQSNIRLGRVKWIFDPYPDNSPLITPYTDGGYNGAKFLQGFKLEAAGNGQVTVDYDGDQASEAFLTNHMDSDGVGVLITKAYSFQNPIIAHELRLRTNPDNGIMRLGKIEWVFEKAPELVEHWVTQGTSHGIPGYQFLKDGFIAYQSTTAVILTVIMEGAGEVYQFILPSTAGQYKKSYVLLGTGLTRALKDKLFRYRLDTAVPGSGFRLFHRDCEIRIHAWEGGEYVVKQPFGDVSDPDGARI